MSSFFGRMMILLLVVDLNRSFASIYYDNVTDTEYEYADNEDVPDIKYEVISLEKKNFRLMTIIGVSPYEAMSFAKFHQFITVLCRYWDANEGASIPFMSHIRVYEDRHPFNLLFIINTDEIQDFKDMIWSKKTESLFIHSFSEGIWQIRWEDHLMRKFVCPLKVTPGYMSLTNDGHVLIVGLEDKLLYVCNVNGTLIRKMSFVKTYKWDLITTFGEYAFPFVHYDPRLDDENGTSEVDLRLSEMNDFKEESSDDVNGTTEYEIVPMKIKNFSLFIMSHVPEKGNDFHLTRLTIERRNKINKHLAAEYSALDESLVDQFISNRFDSFFYWYGCSGVSNETWCFAPSATDDPSVASKRKHYENRPDDAVLSFWIISYYYDSEEDQFIAGVNNIYIADSQIYILFLH